MSKYCMSRVMDTAIFNNSGADDSERLPSGDAATRADLLCNDELRVVYFIGSFAAAVKLQKCILDWNREDIGKTLLEREPIRIIMKNIGGDTRQMWSLIDTMKASRTPIFTINLSECHNEASLVFMAGWCRFMMPSASLSINETHAFVAAEATILMKEMKKLQNDNKAVMKYIADKTKLPMQKIKSLMAQGCPMNAEKCLEYGICDQILTSFDDIL